MRSNEREEESNVTQFFCVVSFKQNSLYLYRANFSVFSKTADYPECIYKQIKFSSLINSLTPKSCQKPGKWENETKRNSREKNGRI